MPVVPSLSRRNALHFTLLTAQVYGAFVLKGRLVFSEGAVHAFGAVPDAVAKVDCETWERT